VGVRFRNSGAFAVALILAGIALPVAYARWFNTRTFVALELPISLARGRVSSTDFTVNLKGWYQIGVDVDQAFSFRSDCGFGGFPPLLRTHISIYEDGRILEQSDGADRFVGHFHAEPGRRYRFDIDVLTDASCLNPGHPFVYAWTEPYPYFYFRDVLWAVSAVLFLWGIGALFFSLADARVHSPKPDPEFFVPSDRSAYPRARHAKPLKGRFARIPSFALLYTITLGSVILPAFLIFLYSWGYDHRGAGIRVRLIPPAPLRFSDSFRPLDVPLRVECTRLNSSPRLYLNSIAVQPNELPGALKIALKSRPDWIVYVTGDSDCNWQDVADAIDIVRNAGAQVVLLTANTPHSNVAGSHKQSFTLQAQSIQQ
jgi:hypothetical protein